ncbi:hypothetical protein B0H11DRAFT_1916765 [Mycena galericulata]|nr:hypothetical protein B0H11DRAFT_1916765 [Mycena galericulata]
MDDTAVPDEIWDEIFGYLPRNELMQVQLTQRRFSSISRPLLFREFDFHPYDVRDTDQSLPQDVLSDLISRRLKFWTSTEIAPLVRTCRATRRRTLPIGIQEIDNPWPLLTDFFDALHHFTNLAHLILATVQYNMTCLQNLRLLPHLTQLEVDSCFVEGTIDPSNLTPLRISDFRYKSHFASTPSPALWLPLLARTTLCHFATEYQPELFAQIVSGHAFPCVKRLEFGIDVSVMLSNLRVLSRFSATEVLIIRYGYGNHQVESAQDSEESDMPLSNILTSLEEYRGPDDLLPLLLPIPSLRRLCLPGEEPSTRLAKLRSIKTPNNVTSLDVYFSDFDHEDLCELCGFFPHLTDLFITVRVLHEKYTLTLGQHPSWEVYQFLGELTEDLPFPSGIQKLAIHWEFEDGKTHIEDGAPDVYALTEALISKYPDLKAIWVDGYPGFVYYWRDGEVEVQYHKYMVDDDAYWERKLRNKIKVSWKTI